MNKKKIKWSFKKKKKVNYYQFGLNMPSIMQKNYSHCPLKKRPVQIVKEEIAEIGNLIFSIKN